MPIEKKRAYVGEFQRWRCMLAFNPRQHHHLVDEKLEFNAYASRADLPTADILALVTTRSEELGFPKITSEADLAGWMKENEVDAEYLNTLPSIAELVRSKLR